MREDICYRYTFCPMCPLSVHICVQQITHLVDSAQFPPLMQNREEDWPRSGPAQLRKARLTHPTWESAPTQLEAVTWETGHEAVTSWQVTTLWKPLWKPLGKPLPTDQPLASGYWLLARDVGYLIWGVSVFDQSGFHLIRSGRQVTLDKTSQIVFSNLIFFLFKYMTNFTTKILHPLKKKFVLVFY